jgi:hypothetical protein
MEKAKHEIRARHILCVLGFMSLDTNQNLYWHDKKSAQYIHTIIPNFKRLATTVEITTRIDDICHHCTLCINQQCFKFKQANTVYTQYDQEIIATLSLEENRLYHPIYIIEQIQRYLRKKDHCKKWCSPCQLQEQCCFYQRLK